MRDNLGEEAVPVMAERRERERQRSSGGEREKTGEMNLVGQQR